MAARNMFIEIYEYPYKFMTFARMLGRPHGGAPTGLCRNSQKINSFKNRGDRLAMNKKIIYKTSIKSKRRLSHEMPFWVLTFTLKHTNYIIQTGMMYVNYI